jgi:hypothetical protein
MHHAQNGIRRFFSPRKSSEFFFPEVGGGMGEFVGMKVHWENQDC